MDARWMQGRFGRCVTRQFAARLRPSVFALLTLAGSAAAQDNSVPTDVSQVFTPQFSLRFIERGYVPRQLSVPRQLVPGPPVSRQLTEIAPTQPSARLAPSAVSGAVSSPAPTEVFAGRRELPFLLPGHRSISAAQLSAASVFFSDQRGQEFTSPDRSYRVRAVRGVFDFSVGAVDPALWNRLSTPKGDAASGFAADVVPGASHVMTFRNMPRDSRLEITIDRRKLAPLDQSDFTPTNIVIAGDTPGIEVAQVASGPDATTYSVTATSDQVAANIEFSPTTDIERVARSTGSDAPPAYPDGVYPPDVNRSAIKLSDNTTDYRRLFSPFSKAAPLDFRWSPVLAPAFSSVGLTRLTLPGKELRVFTFPGKAVIDPAQLAWGANFGSLASRLKEPASVWKGELTPSFCHSLNTTGHHIRVAGLAGAASIEGSGANIDLFGATGECYFSGLYHEGTDFIVPSGTSIYSVLPGRVHSSGYWPNAGGHVGIIVGEFRPTNTTLSGPFYLEVQYLHLNHCQFNFKLNQTIGAGERLGVTASRGQSRCNTTYSPHLHIDTAIIYYDKNVMHKFYFDSLLFLNQANAFGMQVNKTLKTGGSDAAALPAPVFSKWAFSGCTSPAGTTPALVAGRPQTCTLNVETVPNGLTLRGASFTYSLSYVRGGKTGTTPILPGTDTWSAGGGNVTYHASGGALSFGLPLAVKQDAARSYRTLNVFGVLTFSNGTTKRIAEPLPVSP